MARVLAGYANERVKLPNGERADLGTKLEDCVLDPRHPEGRHKARVFEAVLGITRENADPLRDALLAAAHTSDEAEWRGDVGFGDVYLLRVPVVAGDRSAAVVSAWIVRHGEDFPRLVTCYIG